uniref:NADH-ubiquinone oxidoreductase chain 3 n=1 Tax=Belzebub intermedius TaxID=2306298 RepID=A0A346RNH8_9EUCA|nr:NADH dehydrogenase subunit 3 [Belzebub intermedius]AXS67625.1 NADH dehydrogenase subunit 3 [Belzebub intermedius]
MLTLLTSISFTIVVGIAVMLLASLLAKKMIKDREKSSPFECGFDPKSSARLPFSMRFFLIAIIFLIFDVEIALILPMAFILKTSFIQTWSLVGVFFLLVLLLGLYHEWNQGALNWTN